MFHWGERTGHGDGLCASPGSERTAAARSDTCRFRLRVSAAAFLPGNPGDSIAFLLTPVFCSDATHGP